MWQGDTFVYTKKILRVIADNYCSIYEGLPSGEGSITNPYAIAEYKSDFDRALNSIGRGHWDGELREYKYYKGFGKLQIMVIADILGVPDSELWRYDDIPRWRGYAYYRMASFLNGGDSE